MQHQYDHALEDNPYLTTYPTIGDEIQLESTNCNPCQNSNPPPWCYDPGNPCYTGGVSIEPGVIGFAMIISFGIFLIRKQIKHEKINFPPSSNGPSSL